MTDWIVSLDIGGSKTDVLMVNKQTLKGLLFTGEGCNPTIYGKESSERLNGILIQSGNKSGLNFTDVSRCIIGMAGISNRKYRNIFDDIFKSTFSAARLQFISDAEMAHCAIWENKPGISLVVSTGSIAIGKDEKGDLHRAGGLGFQLGDEGSGYWLGKTTLMEIISSERIESGEAVNLRRYILTKTGYSDFDEFVSSLSQDTVSVMEVARIAELLLAAAEEGNSLAGQVAYRGAESLAKIVREITKKLKLSSDRLEIGMSGSLILKSLFYRNLITENLLMHYDDVKWIGSKYPPVYGGMSFIGINSDNLEISIV